MNNKGAWWFIIALGVILLVVGIFASNNNMTNIPQGQSINTPGNMNGMNGTELITNDQGGNTSGTQIGTNTNLYNNSNLDMQKSDRLCNSLESDDRYSDVKALVSGNNAMVSCSFNNSADANTMKTALIQKVKEIEPNITNVKIVETQTASNTFTQMFNDAKSNGGSNLSERFMQLFNSNNSIQKQ